MLHILLIQSFHLLLGNRSMMQSHICVWNRCIPNKYSWNILTPVMIKRYALISYQIILININSYHDERIIFNTNIANRNNFCFIDLFRTMKVPSIVRDLMWCFLLLAYDFKKVGKGSTTIILVVSLHRKFWQRLFIGCPQLRIISHLNIVQLATFLVKF